MENWETQLRAEFEKATQARIKHNEGQARVCARRAAGIAVREYFARQGNKLPNSSAMDLLKILRAEAPLTTDLLEMVDHLELRVTTEFTLPIPVDLIAEARILCRWLLPDWRG
ncbi:MAG: hypothetical protein IT311_13305 [Anaerolineales bacterium]|nr:hypothetical protein [Anaerolineales bacterium]MCZ2122093.1 hypothetical protein [Anaerolineales bacterium]